MQGSIFVLGIETSCDDTAAAVLADGAVLSNVVSAQGVHQAYGGVVPELASRQHMVLIAPVVAEALRRADLRPSQLSAIAYTQGPGLLGALMVGASFAKAYALGLGIPSVAVNHMQGHLASVFIHAPRPQFPALVLTVSGGHTQLSLMHSVATAEMLGQTLDDAAGEAFDKIGKLLGLPYPAGPHIDRLAKQAQPGRHPLPAPQVPGFGFSFSGLKTAVLYYLRKQVAHDPNFIQDNLAGLCADVQQRIVQSLLEKLFSAAGKFTDVKHLAVVGGVSANSELRKQFNLGCAERGLQPFVPPVEYCTDNAAMIAWAGYQQFLAGTFADDYTAPFPS